MFGGGVEAADTFDYLMYDSTARVTMVYAAIRQAFGVQWFRACDLISACRSSADLRRAVCLAIGEKATTKPAAMWLSRHREHKVDGSTLGAMWSPDHEMWTYRIERDGDEVTPLKLRPPSPRILKPPAEPKPPKAEPQRRVILVPELPPREERARDEAEILKARIRSNDEREAEQTRLLASDDPAPFEVWAGPFDSREDAESAAARIKKHGLGCDGLAVEIDGEHFARSVGAKEAARTADSIRRILSMQDNARRKKRRGPYRRGATSTLRDGCASGPRGSQGRCTLDASRR